MTANQIAYQRQREEARANLAREVETNRSNLANEAQKRNELAENSRHNLVTENETYRSNVARETENTRHNLETERETNRSNLAKEFENSRHNKVDEAIRQRTVNESIRHNQAQEGLDYQRNFITGQHYERSDETADYRATEERRANQAAESNKYRIASLEQREQNKRKRAELETQAAIAGYQGVSNSLSSLIRTLGGGLFK